MTFASFLLLFNRNWRNAANGCDFVPFIIFRSRTQHLSGKRLVCKNYPQWMSIRKFRLDATANGLCICNSLRNSPFTTTHNEDATVNEKKNAVKTKCDTNETDASVNCIIIVGSHAMRDMRTVRRGEYCKKQRKFWHEITLQWTQVRFLLVSLRSRWENNFLNSKTIAIKFNKLMFTRSHHFLHRGMRYRIANFICIERYFEFNVCFPLNIVAICWISIIRAVVASINAHLCCKLSSSLDTLNLFLELFFSSLWMFNF